MERIALRTLLLAVALATALVPRLALATPDDLLRDLRGLDSELRLSSYEQVDLPLLDAGARVLRNARFEVLTLDGPNGASATVVQGATSFGGTIRRGAVSWAVRRDRRGRLSAVNEREVSAPEGASHCGNYEASGSVPPFPRSDAHMGTKLPLREIRLLIVASPDFTTGRSEEEVLQAIAVATAGANRYLAELRLALRVVGVQLLQSGAFNPYADETQAQSAWGMLDQVRALWASRQFPQRELTAVFAGSPFNNVYGLAYSGVSCTAPDQSFIFVTRGGEAPAYELGSTLAHEVGHFLGIAHDVPTSGAPGVMSPFHLKHAEGFSASARAAYLARALPGAPGGDCFNVTDPTRAPLPDMAPSTAPVFLGGEQQRLIVREGEPLVHHLALVAGAYSPGVIFEASGLPAGARLDPLDGILSYLPGFDVSSPGGVVELEFKVAARGFSGVGATTVTIAVHDANRVPEISSSAQSRPESGRPFAVTVRAIESDPGDMVRELRVVNARGVRGTGAQIVKRSATELDIFWTELPVEPVAILAEAIDLGGGIAQKIVPIEPLPHNAAPKISVEQLSAGGILVTATDPENDALALDVFSAPPGSIVHYNSKGMTLYYTPQQNALSGAEITISVTDGTSSVTTTASFSGVSTASPTSGSPWPGKAGSSSLLPAALVRYNAATGDWERVGCDSAATLGEPYGGVPSDFPLLLDRGRVSERRAVYRPRGFQGFWYIENDAPVAFGLRDDVPLIGDIDGDGNDELLVYRPADGSWHALMPEGATILEPLRLPPADSAALRTPFVGDVDGDGRADRLLFVRRANGELVFHVARADGGRMSFHLGAVPPTAIARPLVGDLDGDGRLDLSVRSGAELHLLRSSSASLSTFSLPDSGEATALRCGGRAAIAQFQRDGMLVTTLEDGHSWFDGTPTIPHARTLEELALGRAYRLNRGAVGDVDGDRRSDEVVLRRGALGSSLLVRGTRGATKQQFAFQNGYLIEGNFLRLGQTVPGVFSGGVWQFRTDESRTTVRWGISGDVPVPGDYNGDGFSDLAVYRPSDSSWWIALQGIAPENVGTQWFAFWGEAGDIPVPADYDGDGATDIAVFRPTTATWYTVGSSSGAAVVHFGKPGDLPVPGDFFGDGRDRVATWQSDSAWWSVQEGGGALRWQWGSADDAPVLSDADGDGALELSVYRPRAGTWYRRLSQSSFANVEVTQWGLPQDLPLGGRRHIRQF